MSPSVQILVAEEGAAAELAAGQPEPELGAAASVGGSTGKRRGDSSVEVVHGAEDEEELVFEGDVESPDEVRHAAPGSRDRRHRTQDSTLTGRLAQEEIIDGEADGGSAEAMDSVAELEQAVRAWRPGVDKLDDGEELQFDNKSYTMFHRMRMEVRGHAALSAIVRCARRRGARRAETSHFVLHFVLAPCSGLA